MSDLIKRISNAKEMIEKKPNQSTVDYTIYGVLTDCDITLKSQQAEIERLKAQKQKWLQNIADQQLAVSPTGYETEEGLAKRTGEWNGLQMAWEILTKE